ncbi:hypothetical protein NQK81_01770 [Amycolatopsis roodepoortensis]|uniref:hypothetical protein n=1 Tax=Amycolatopsis roodepoortensis TaxID=700274 RepID=UPI00214B328B|nr:hypothetical protein [Amycolatopsis roodepoortensis]UUV32202.1 hypothetical protein NQK81_01770 [Amycolatopsis roodepoortensis]
MFWVGLNDQATTPVECQPYEQPIRNWLESAAPGDDVVEIWFFRPEIPIWEPSKPRGGQDIVVDGGVILRSGQAYRLVLEIHDAFCHCAWCQDEPSVAGEAEWVANPAAFG